MFSSDNRTNLEMNNRHSFILNFSLCSTHSSPKFIAHLYDHYLNSLLDTQFIITQLSSLSGVYFIPSFEIYSPVLSFFPNSLCFFQSFRQMSYISQSWKCGLVSEMLLYLLLYFKQKHLHCQSTGLKFKKRFEAFLAARSCHIQKLLAH